MRPLVEGGAMAWGGILYLKHLWDSWKSHRIGIYGLWGCGKTTLNGYLNTSGELEEDSERITSTAHPYNKKKKQYVPPPATRKRIHVLSESNTGHRRTILSTDLGGQPEYFNLWLRDLVMRDVEVVIYLIDARDDPDGHQQATFRDFTRIIAEKDFRFTEKKLRKKARNYQPKVVALVANKSDLWLTQEERVFYEGPGIGRHPIFDEYRPHLIRLQRAGIPTLKRSISALHGYDVERLIWDCLKAKS